jgi:hypothetical protein
MQNLRVICYPYTGLDMPLYLQDSAAPKVSRQLAHEGRKVVSPAAFNPGVIPGIDFC